MGVDPSGDVVCAGSHDTFEVFVWSMQTGRLLEVGVATHEHENKCPVQIEAARSHSPRAHSIAIRGVSLGDTPPPQLMAITSSNALLYRSGELQLVLCSEVVFLWSVHYRRFHSVRCTGTEP